MGKILICPEYDRLLSGPVIFLGGPIQGAPDWHSDAIALLQKITPATIASPRRNKMFFEEKYAREDFLIQVCWEHLLMDIAGRTGVILFWCAKEAEHFCERAYAQTTRFEMGWKIATTVFTQTRVVVGIEPGFSNERYLRETIPIASKRRVKIYSTLKETCKMAAALLRS